MRGKNCLVGLLLFLIFAFAISKVLAQIPYLVGSASYETLLPQYMQKTADVMRSYYYKNKRMPQFEQEMDNALIAIHNKININPADTTKMRAISEGRFRVFGSFRMCIDNSISNENANNWRNIRPPDNWSAPPYSIVIMVDGNNQFLIWAAAVDYRPLRDSNQRPMIIYEKCE